MLQAAGTDNRDVLEVGRGLKLILPSNGQPSSSLLLRLLSVRRSVQVRSDGSIEKTTAVPSLHGGDHSTQFPVTRVQQVCNSM